MSSQHLVDAALARAAAARDGGERAPPPAAIRRSFVVGDPQATAERFFSVLAHHRLLGASGWLARDASLASVGDHFDFRSPLSLREVGEEGRLILSWLAAHEPTQVAILLGNHDTSRVMELARFDDDSFARAQAEARALEERRKQGTVDASLQRDAEAFLRRWPALPSAELADRDYSAFSVSQRELVRALLTADQARLALAVTLVDHTPALLTHAGLTSRELALLGLEQEREPRKLAAALNAFLAERVELAAADWARGDDVALDLLPLHRAGGGGVEGGGLLYHRPTRPEVKNDPTALELRRRFVPYELPRGLVQVCGHVGHKKLLEELGDWVTREARALSPGALRTLDVSDDEVRYAPFAPGPADEARAVLHFTDGAMNTTRPEEVQLLPLAPTSFGD